MSETKEVYVIMLKVSSSPIAAVLSYGTQSEEDAKKLVAESNATAGPGDVFSYGKIYILSGDLKKASNKLGKTPGFRDAVNA